MHLVVFLLCLAGFACLALATQRAQEDIFGHALPRPSTLLLRLAGWSALVFGLLVTTASQGWALGLVIYSGHTSLCAALVYGALIVRARMARARSGKP